MLLLEPVRLRNILVDPRDLLAQAQVFMRLIDGRYGSTIRFY